MDPQQLDGAVRVSGATLLLLLAAALMRDGRSRRLAVYFLPLALCLAGFLAGNTPDPGLRLHGLLGAAAHLLSGYAAVFLWWFCLASFDPEFRPRGAGLGFGLAWLLIASADRGVFGPAPAERGLSWLLVAMGFAMVGHLAWRLVRDRDGDLLEGRRRARVLVVVALAGLLFVELAKEVVFGLDWRPRGFTIAENAAILAFSLWMLARVARPAAAAPARPPAADPAALDPLAERLRILVEVERAHLDPGLTFEAFARRMGAPEREVRRLINHRLGHSHFRAFLGACRVDEARRLLADPARAGDKLIAIALDSGFASIASFNRAFRAVEGRAPSDYRAGLGRQADEGFVPAFEDRSAAF